MSLEADLIFQAEKASRAQVAPGVGQFDGPAFNLRCTLWHIFPAEPGSELEKRCIEHVERYGFDEVLTVSWKECPVCSTQMADYYGVLDPHVAYEQGVHDAKLGLEARHPFDLVYMDGWRSVKEG